LRLGDMPPTEHTLNDRPELFKAAQDINFGNIS